MLMKRLSEAPVIEASVTFGLVESCFSLIVKETLLWNNRAFKRKQNNSLFFFLGKMECYFKNTFSSFFTANIILLVAFWTDTLKSCFLYPKHFHLENSVFIYLTIFKAK